MYHNKKLVNKTQKQFQLASEFRVGDSVCHIWTSVQANAQLTWLRDSDLQVSSLLVNWGHYSCVNALDRRLFSDVTTVSRIQQLFCLIGTNWQLVWAIMSLALMTKSKTYRTTEIIVHATAFRNKWDDRSLAPQTQAHSESGAGTRHFYPLTR